MRTYSRRSPTRRSPNKAGGCQALTFRSSRPMNFSLQDRIECCLHCPIYYPSSVRGCPSSTADGRSTANSRSESVSDGRRLERSWRGESADRRRNRAALEKSVDRALLNCAPIEGQRAAYRGDGALDVVIGVGR